MVAENLPSIRAVRPAPPRAPDDYDRDWAAQLNRWLQTISDDLSGYLYLRISGMYFPNPPTSAAGLPDWAVFSNVGVLTFVLPGHEYISGVSASTGLGTPTVHT